MNRKALRGSLLLLFGAVIWGAAFAAQRMGMDHVGPFTFSGVRMLLAGLVMIPVAAAAGRKVPEKTAEDRKRQRTGGLICGILLFAATSLQQIGLVDTAAGKAGFITALYVVLVPVAGWLILRNNPGRVIWIGVALAVAALYLLCVPDTGFQVERGDLLLLGCAVCFTGQILCVDHYAPRVSGVALARDEFLVTGGLSMITAILTEEIRWDGITEAMIPILYTGICSGALGYTLQIIGQKEVNPTLASLIMCLESVFAVLTGAVLLGERMTGREVLGSVLMFTAVILAQLSPVLEGKMKTSRTEKKED
ncbi:MAG: DMT family transporter [Clostridia bacterium]|nr:DMT family transporter [Clostridia bacterium]